MSVTVASSQNRVRRHRATSGLVRVEVEVPPGAAGDIRRLARLRRESEGQGGTIELASPDSGDLDDVLGVFNAVPAETQLRLAQMMKALGPNASAEVRARFQRIAQNFLDFAERANTLSNF